MFELNWSFSSSKKKYFYQICRSIQKLRNHWFSLLSVNQCQIKEKQATTYHHFSYHDKSLHGYPCFRFSALSTLRLWKILQSFLICSLTPCTYYWIFVIEKQTLSHNQLLRSKLYQLFFNSIYKTINMWPILNQALFDNLLWEYYFLKIGFEIIWDLGIDWIISFHEN